MNIHDPMQEQPNEYVFPESTTETESAQPSADEKPNGDRWRRLIGEAFSEGRQAGADAVQGSAGEKLRDLVEKGVYDASFGVAYGLAFGLAMAKNSAVRPARSGAREGVRAGRGAARGDTTATEPIVPGHPTGQGSA